MPRIDQETREQMNHEETNGEQTCSEDTCPDCGGPLSKPFDHNAPLFTMSISLRELCMLNDFLTFEDDLLNDKDILEMQGELFTQLCRRAADSLWELRQSSNNQSEGSAQ
jgi:hypothetical protein